MPLLEILKSKARSIDFVKTVDRPLCPFQTDLMTIPITKMKVYEPVLGAPLFSYRNEVCVSGAFYDDSSILEKEEELIRAKQAKNPGYLEERARAAEEMGEGLLRYCLGISERRHELASSQQMLLAIRGYIERAEKFLPWFTFTISAGNYLEKLLRGNLRTRFGDLEKAKRALFVLTCPSRPTLQLREQKAFLEMALKSEREGISDELLGAHARRFGFIGFRHGTGEFWTKEELRKRLKECKEPAKELLGLEEARRSLEEEKSELRESLGDFRKEAEIAEKYVWLRTYRSDVYSQSFGLIAPVMSQYAIALGHDSRAYLNFSVEDFLSGRNPAPEELASRGEGFAAASIDCEIFYLSGQEALDFRQFLDRTQCFEGEIKGTVASRPVSKMRGTVKLVASPKDFSKVKSGDVIVATMTTPDFVPILRTAAGFVTDEGGILCHAAILSREFGKPCIVGTKTATALLKDGDLVEMDLETGVVRIPEKSLESSAPVN